MLLSTAQAVHTILCRRTMSLRVNRLQHEATMLFHLKELVENGIVPGLVAYGDSLGLGGAIAYIAMTLVPCGRPFPPDPSRCERSFRTRIHLGDCMQLSAALASQRRHT